MRKVQRNVRLDPAAEKVLDDLAEKRDLTISAVVRGLVPSPAWATIIEAERRPDEESEGGPDPLYRIAADGLKRRMMQNEPPVDPHFVEPITPEAIPGDYLEFLDAVATAAGVKGPLGNRFHFAKPPRGGEWERMGVTGWGVLPINARFTKDGTNYSAGAE